jgi:hypothetical protein
MVGTFVFLCSVESPDTTSLMLLGQLPGHLPQLLITISLAIQDQIPSNKHGKNQLPPQAWRSPEHRERPSVAQTERDTHRMKPRSAPTSLHLDWHRLHPLGRETCQLRSREPTFTCEQRHRYPESLGSCTSKQQLTEMNGSHAIRALLTTLKAAICTEFLYLSTWFSGKGKGCWMGMG